MPARRATALLVAGVCHCSRQTWMQIFVGRVADKVAVSCFAVRHPVDALPGSLILSDFVAVTFSNPFSNHGPPSTANAREGKFQFRLRQDMAVPGCSQWEIPDYLKDWSLKVFSATFILSNG